MSPKLVTHLACSFGKSKHLVNPNSTVAQGRGRRRNLMRCLNISESSDFKIPRSMMIFGSFSRFHSQLYQKEKNIEKYHHMFETQVVGKYFQDDAQVKLEQSIFLPFYK